MGTNKIQKSELVELEVLEKIVPFFAYQLQLETIHLQLILSI